MLEKKGVFASMRKTMKKFAKITMAFAVCLMAFACSKRADDGKTELSIGHFPNITHAQALVAHQLSRQGRGWFESRLGDNVKIAWRVFNAGPSAMESLFAGAVDVTYVGPSPAINAFSKTGGRDIRIVSGSADGGSTLVVKPSLNIKKVSDFKGKTIATPQLGNTQDVACRAWLIENGLKVDLTGRGDATVQALANPEQLMMFRRGDIDAVWTVEPWVSRLILEGGAAVFHDQREAVTTVVATSLRTARNHPELLEKFVKAHRELTDWINANPGEAQKLVQMELTALSGGNKVSMELVKAAWPRIVFTNTVNRAELQKFVDRAYNCGFLKKKTDITNIFSVK